MENRLLILSCSQRKQPNSEPIPALERYDGPAFHVLRKYMDYKPHYSLQVYILSAQYGLIPANKCILNYDQRMTLDRAKEIQSQVRTQLQEICLNQEHDKVFIHAGKLYLQTLEDFEAVFPSKTMITIASGSPGKRLSEMRRWLYVDLPVQATRKVVQRNGSVCFKGVEISFTAEEIIALGHEALKNGAGQQANYHTWYVLIDDQKVSPKWLVSKLTRIPVSTFHTGDAIRLLERFGLTVDSS